MTNFKFILRSLVYNRGINVWTVLGAMTGVAVLTGALIIGDSIRYSLRQIVYGRLGKTEYALVSGERFIDSRVADTIARKLDTPVAPLLLLKGMVVAGGETRRANLVQVVGYDSRFASLGGSGVFRKTISGDGALVNTHIAGRLGLKEGDEFLLRMYNPGLIPKDMAWALVSDAKITKRFTVRALVSDTGLGGFNLKADQTAPFTVFVPMETLGRMMGLEGKSNTILVAERAGKPISPEILDRAFRESWSITNAGFTLETLPDINAVELKSERIFLDPGTVAAAQKTYPDSRGVFSYFVNEIRVNGKAAPYSFVSAFSGQNLAEDEMIVNEWLARDLEVKKSDTAVLSYYTIGPSRSLEEKSSVFRVKAILPVRKGSDGPGLAPDFPGLRDAENCRSWDPGIPIDLGRIREKDEQYWKNFRGTPKAFVSLSTAQKMWGGRYGELTAIRFPGADKDTVEKRLTEASDPAGYGYFFRNARSEGLAAGARSMGFDQLFLGLSFFIILAALLLTGLFFVFAIERRSGEIGTLLALGFPRRHVALLLLSEGMILAALGSFLGAPCGIAYHQGILLALKSVWRDIANMSSLHVHVVFPTVMTAIAIGAAVNFLAVLFAVWDRLRRPAAGLQKGGVSQGALHARSLPGLAVAVGCFIGVLMILAASLAGAFRDITAPFFASGALLLTGFVAFAYHGLIRYSTKAKNSPLNIGGVGVRNAARKPFRSLAVTGLLALGVFIVFTVGANRRSAVTNAHQRESGTGGFAFIGQCAVPMLYDLNSPKGRDFYSLQELDPDKVSFVSFRVREGDDASCLNLNRVSSPQLIGVDPDELSRRKAFSFTQTAVEADPANPWGALKNDLPGGVVPGVADQTVITWGLGKSVGDTLEYRDENGKAFKIKLVGGLSNSIFQGNVIISGDALLRKYPSVSGFGMFIVEAPFPEMEEISRKLDWALRDQGVDLERTYDRLAAFNAVENTYLSIFLILGAFGLLIGSIGIAVVIGRNVEERRGEIGLLQAVGYQKSAVAALLISEHSALLIAGLAAGVVSALLASIPSLAAPGSNLPWITILCSLILISAGGGFWVYAAALLATKRDFLQSLRNE